MASAASSASSAVSGMAGDMESGGVKLGNIEVKFPPMPPPNNSPITIQTPPSSYPTVIANPKKQKPIVVVPELIYPHKVRRVVVHHENPMQDYYHQMSMSMNPVYTSMAQNNQYYSDIVNNSSAFKNFSTN